MSASDRLRVHYLLSYFSLSTMYISILHFGHLVNFQKTEKEKKGISLEENNRQKNTLKKKKNIAYNDD